MPTMENNFVLPAVGGPELRDISDIGLAAASLGGIGMLLWAVPSLILSLPGVLVVVVILAQALGGFAWLPIVKRKIGGFGLGPRRMS
jgi:hypothetical protein